MQRSLQQLVSDLATFVENDDDLTLVFDITDHEVPFVFNALESVDATMAEHVFLNFAHPVKSGPAYMKEVHASIALQLQAVNAIRAEDELPPWPPLPPDCTDPRRSPGTQFRSLLQYVHAQLPEDGGHRVVLALVPGSLDDPAAYAQIIQGLLPRDEIEPWMPRTRIILRDDRNKRFIAPFVAEHHPQGVGFYDGLDFSPAAGIAALEQSAQDPDTPDEERMMALVQLAALDFSYRRHPESLRKWGVCYSYYTETKVDAMRILCVCGAADVLRETGKLPEAKEKYQQGLAIEQTQQTLPATLNLLLGLSRTCILMEEWKDAEGYLELADDVASKLCQAYPKCEVMERQGFVMWKQRRMGDARTKWRAAADLSRELQIFDVCERCLQQLVELFQHAHMRQEQRDHQRELDEIRFKAKVAAHKHAQESGA